MYYFDSKPKREFRPPTTLTAMELKIWFLYTEGLNPAEIRKTLKDEGERNTPSTTAIRNLLLKRIRPFWKAHPDADLKWFGSYWSSSGHIVIGHFTWINVV